MTFWKEYYFSRTAILAKSNDAGSIAVKSDAVQLAENSDKIMTRAESVPNSDTAASNNNATTPGRIASNYDHR